MTKIAIDDLDFIPWLYRPITNKLSATILKNL